MLNNSDSTSLAKLYTYARSVVGEMEIIPTANKLPSFVELKKSPNKFYEMFSEATYNYNVICDALQKLQHTNAMLVKVINELMSNTCCESAPVKSQYLKNFTNVKTECAALIPAYETAKASAESIVKYYNSAQFVITSNRFDSQTVNY